MESRLRRHHVVALTPTPDPHTLRPAPTLTLDPQPETPTPSPTFWNHVMEAGRQRSLVFT